MGNTSSFESQVRGFESGPANLIFLDFSFSFQKEVRDAHICFFAAEINQPISCYFWHSEVRKTKKRTRYLCQHRPKWTREPNLRCLRPPRNLNLWKSCSGRACLSHVHEVLFRTFILVSTGCHLRSYDNPLFPDLAMASLNILTSTKAL